MTASVSTCRVVEEGIDMLFRTISSSRAMAGAALLASVSTTALGQEVRGPESPKETSNGPSPASTASGTPQSTEAAEPAQAGLTDIVVTARKISENLQSVPVAVTAFSGADLQKQNAVGIKDIALLTPGLNIQDGAAARSAPVISLRGNAQAETVATVDPSVGTYVDGYYWARAYGANADLLDVQSVQVLKGPQGTLFGRNTTGGAILLQTNDPSFQGASGLVSGTYGRFNERGATGVINLPIVDDKIALRVAGTFRKRDGYITNSFNGRKVDNVNAFTGRVKLLAQPTEALSLLFSAEYYRVNELSQPFRLGYTTPLAADFSNGLGTLSYGIQAGIANPADAYTALNGYIAETKGSDTYATNDETRSFAKTQTYTGTATLDTSFGAVKFISGYRKVQAFSLLDIDGTPYTTLVAGPVPGQRYQQSLQQYSGELQITGKALSDALDFAVGALYFHESGYDRSGSRALPPLNPNNPNIFDGAIDNDSMGLYGQGTYHLTDRLSLTGGLRYSIEDKGIRIRNRVFGAATGGFVCSLGGATLPPECLSQRRDSFSGVDYTAAVDYRVAPDVLVYLKTAKGFRSGGQNLRSTGTSGVAFAPFEPEVARSYEGGVKSEFLNRRVRLNVAAYYTDLSNIQRSTYVTGPDGSPAIRIGNAGKARIYGGEAELTALLFEGFQVIATGAITKPKYIRYFDGQQDRSNDYYTYVPQYTFSLSGDYSHDISFGKLLLRTDYAWSSRIYFDPSNNLANPDNNLIRQSISAKPLGILNARAGLSFGDGQFELAVFGRNITSNRSVTVGTLASAPLGYTFFRRREPATFGVTATVKIGH
jgi:iron complex outermembrane recepter protein